MPKLFGTSGVRGIVNVELTPQLMFEVGLAVSTLIRDRNVGVACDTRRSRDMLRSAWLSGVIAGGSKAVDLGILPTPVLAYLTHVVGFEVGAMITASHNPPEYNGIKLFDREGVAYGPTQQSAVESIIENHESRLASWNNIGTINSIDESSRYVEMVCDKIHLNKKWNVLVDPGCGAGHSIAPYLLRLLGCKVTAVNSQPDGFFPGRSPEPSPESLKSFSLLVKQIGADLGIAYDGDADRVAFVDERGDFIQFDRSLAAIAGHFLKQNNGGTVVIPIDASMSVDTITLREHGEVERTPVGDVEIAWAIRKKRAVFGGEPCGAWIMPQFHMCPDGILSSILFLKALETENVTASNFISKVPEYPIMREKVSCPTVTKASVMAKLKDRLPAQFHEELKVSLLDGIRIATEDWWLLLRSSGTEPTIRVTAEAKDEKKAKDLLKLGVAEVSKTIKEESG